MTASAVANTDVLTHEISATVKLAAKQLKQNPHGISVVNTQSHPNLNFYTEVYPPSSFYQQGKLTGISIEALQLMWQKLGYPAQPIQVVPWARGYRSLQNEGNAVLFATSRYHAREHLFQWVGPIFTARYILVANNTLADIELSDIELSDISQSDINPE